MANTANSMTQGGSAWVVGSGGSLDIETGGSLKIAGTAISASAAELNKLDGAGAVVASGTQAAKINDASTGATQGAEARAAIVSIIDALEAFGISATA